MLVLVTLLTQWSEALSCVGTLVAVGSKGVVVLLVSSSLGQPAAAAETKSLLFRLNLL